MRYRDAAQTSEMRLPNTPLSKAAATEMWQRSIDQAVAYTATAISSRGALIQGSAVVPRAVRTARRARRQPRTRKADVQRAISAVEQAGLKITGVKVAPDGTVTVLTGQPTVEQPQPLDQWLANRARRT